MNIITDQWIPVVRRSGKINTIRPAQLADRSDPPIRFVWPRADLEIACFELMIGLIYAVDPPAGNDDWKNRIDNHSEEQLNNKLAPLAKWFALDADDGPRFLQDLEPLSESALPLTRLFIDAPGENTEKKNADLFVKRSSNIIFSQPLAAMSLYTLQAFAPTGGSGIRTSMRGGGPMVTLIEPHAKATLMEILWANVPVGMPLPLENATEVARTFPWTVPTPDLKGKLQIHETHDHGDAPHWGAFFGMPRRIRLNFSDEPAECSLTGIAEKRPVTAFVQRKLGIDYGLWRHPTSPYYRQKAASESLPVHPKPGTFGYQHYLGVLLSDNKSKLRDRAHCVSAYIKRPGASDEETRILVAGWAMSNMSALNFIYSRQPAPLSVLAGDAEFYLTGSIEAAGVMASSLGYALASALNIEADKKGNGTDAVTLAKQNFYATTTQLFHKIATDIAVTENWQEIALRWRTGLLKAALSLFDQQTRAHILYAKPERVEKIRSGRSQIISTGSGYSKSGRQICDLLHLEQPKARKKTTNKEDNKHAA